MAETIGTARLDIVVDTSSLDAGVNKAKRSSDDMAKAAQSASQKVSAAEKRKIDSLERSIATYGKSRAEVLRWRIAQLSSADAASRLTSKLNDQIRPMEQAGRAMDRIGGAAKRFAVAWGAIAVAAGGAALTMGINNAIDFADKLNDINQRLGISAEALSGWAFAAKQTGTDIDALGTGLKKLARNMTEALDADSKQGELFKALGINVRDAQGRLKGLEGILPEIANGFQNIENETLKASLAQELFGRSGADLLEFLNLGAGGMEEMRSRARELGVELSGGTLTAADTFNDRMEELKAASSGLAMQLAVALLPELTKLVEQLTDLASDGERSKKFMADLSTVIGGAADVADLAVRGFAVMTNQLAALRTTAEGVLNLDWSRISLGVGSVLNTGRQIGQLRRNRLTGEQDAPEKPVVEGTPGVDFIDFTRGAPLSPEERAQLERRVSGVFAEGGGGGKKARAKKPEKSEAEKELERLEKAYQSLADRQREQIALFGEESEAAQVRYDIEHGALKGLSAEKQKEAIARAETLDTLREEAKVAEELKRIDEARTERAGQVLDDIRTESDLLGKSIEYQDTYNKLKYAGVDANSAFGQSIIEANKALHEQGQATERQIELMDTFRSESSSALSDVVLGFQSVGDAATEAIDAIGERVTRMISDGLIEKLFGQFGTTEEGSGGGWMSKIFGFFSGDSGDSGEAAALSKSAGELAASGATLMGAATALSTSAAALAAASGTQAALGTVGESTTTTGGFDWMGAISAIFGGGFAKGGVFAGGQVQAFANGGVIGGPTMFPMSSGRMGLMGEAGPEAIMPLRRLSNGRLGVETTGKAAQTTNNLSQTFVVQGTPDNRTREQMYRESGRQAARGMSRTGR